MSFSGGSAVAVRRQKKGPKNDGLAGLFPAAHALADEEHIDIGMPGMSGYEVARERRQEFGKQRPLLIAVTGWKQSSDRILAKLAGFDFHLAKPFESTALLTLIAPLAAGSGTRR